MIKDDYEFRYLAWHLAVWAFRKTPGRRAGVPNTLPPQDLNRNAELGRVGSSPCIPNMHVHKCL